MSDYLDKYGSDYEKLFVKSPYLKDKKILQHFQEIYDDYQTYRKNKKEYDFFEKTLNKPWQLARHKLTDKLDYQKMELSDILDYVKQEKSRQKVIKENFLFLSGLNEERSH
ncbi:15791_t:CDS:1, partial [Racocetra persica]